MNSKPSLSRRTLLKALGGAPMLPLAGLSLTAPLAACGGGSDAPPPAPVSFASAEFQGMAAPSLADAAAMATTSVASSLDVHFSDGSTQTYQLAYQPFFTTGDAVPDGSGGTVVAGGYYDIQGNPIIDASVAGQERQFFSDCPDGTSLLTVAGAKPAGVKGNAVFAVVQFEYTSRDNAGTSQYGRLPSQIAVLTAACPPTSS